MITAPSVSIRALSRDDVAGAAAVLGRAMRDNPLHRRAFGENPDHRQQVLTRLFSSTLPRQFASGGTVLGAFDAQAAGALLGVTAFVPPGRCQPTTAARVKGVPTLLGAMGMTGAWRLLAWARQWSRHDPAVEHWHLGPVGVDRHRQGRGIGGALLSAFAARMDELGATSWLETDKRENVRFYDRFGFQVVVEADVLGIPNWFMVRVPPER